MIIITSTIVEVGGGVLVSTRGANIGQSTQMECEAADKLGLALHEAKQLIEKEMGTEGVEITPFMSKTTVTVRGEL
jgi:hypothetical protein